MSGETRGYMPPEAQTDASKSSTSNETNRPAEEAFFAETPDQNLSEGGAQEGFNRPTHQETVNPYSTTSREVGMAGGMTNELGEKMRATQAAEDAMTESKPTNLWDRIKKSFKKAA